MAAETQKTARKKPAREKPAPPPERKAPPDPEQARRNLRLFFDAARVLIGIGFAFVFGAILFPAKTGELGRGIHDFFYFHMGMGSYLMPLLALYVLLHTLFNFTGLGNHWVLLLCVLLQLDACLLLFHFGHEGGMLGRYLGDYLTSPLGMLGRGLLGIGVALISMMLLARVSLQQLTALLKPVLALAGKAIKSFYNFLAFRQEDQGEKLLEAPMESIPDLSSLEEKPQAEEPPEEEEMPREEPVEIAEPEEEPEEEDIPKARDTVETKALDPAAAALMQVGTPDGKPLGYDKLNGGAQDGPGAAQKKTYKYRMPPLTLLKAAEKGDEEKSARDYSTLLEETLGNFGVEVKVINKVRGPTVTRYELQPAKGVKVSKVTNLSNDIALALAAYSIRIEAPIPGKSAIGIEVPNHRIDPVYLRDILHATKPVQPAPLSLALGKDITGKAIAGDLLKMPHLLIAGATGSGKSVCINCVIASMLYRATPYEVQMLMIDPKRVELSLFEGIPHLIDVQTGTGKKIITNPKVATLALKTIGELMDQRYEDFVELKVRNIKEYNEKAEVPIPYVVVIIDELADLMMISSSTVEQYICRIAQLGRASGIHMIVATQRPSVDVITGLIKANIPSRIAFAVSSQVDSRTILDKVGAEKLLGKGDMLYSPVDASEPRRLQGAYVSGEEIEKIVEFWQQQPQPENAIPITVEDDAEKKLDAGDDGQQDPLIPEALEIIKASRQASASNLQRKMKIGYARAGRIMDQLEKLGFVGPADGSKPRRILIPGFEDTGS